MSLSVVTRTIGTVDQRFSLANEQTAIVMDPTILPGWKRLRIGCRFVMPDTGGSITGTPLFCFGLLSAPSALCANGPLTGACSHFVGLYQTAATLTRATSYQFTNTAVTKKVGATVGSHTDSDNQFIPLLEDTARGIMIIEFDRTDPANWVTRYHGPGSTSQAHTDKAQSVLIAGMESEPGGTGVYGTLGYSSGGYSTETIAVDESGDGALNAICVAWNKSSVVEFSDICYSVNEYS